MLNPVVHRVTTGP